MARSVLMLGATSAIAQALAERLARDGDRLFLVARDAARLDIIASDLTIRSGRQIGTLARDLDDVSQHREIIDRAVAALDGLDCVIVAHGILGDPQRSHTSYAELEAVLRTNFLSAASLLTLVAERFEQQGAGTIVAISSVAGDRGRQSNYVYGASKAALSVFLEGLRNRLYHRGVRVLTIKPGLVDTPMTAGRSQSLLCASPERVARGIHRAMRQRRNVVYLPGFWRVVMAGIRLIPESLFKRMRL